jgi:hypothetical protein
VLEGTVGVDVADVVAGVDDQVGFVDGETGARWRSLRCRTVRGRDPGSSTLSTS